jgi:L-alanine-DL-glutamate epimerase-like enolase superfamily enzyme
MNNPSPVPSQPHNLPSNLTIANITTQVFRLPIHGELRWGKSSSLAEVRHVLIRVTLSDGSTGVAEAPPRPTIYGETEHSISSIIAHELAPRLLGQPVSRAVERMQEIKFNHVAKGGLDMAIHDALARSHGLHLADHLAAQMADQPGGLAQSVRVSYILGIGTRDEVLAEAQRVVQQGVRVLKVKVGRSWQEDLARIDELQNLLGPSVDLYADANECMSADEAPRKLAILRERGLLYCEEPLPVELIQERAALRAGNHLPLIADDSTFGERELQRELALDTFDILNIKTARTGFSESLRMLGHAQHASKGVMIGSQASAGLGTLHAAFVSALPGVDHPCELSFFLKLKQDIIQPPIPIVDGLIHLADVRRCQVDQDRLHDVLVR